MIVKTNHCISELPQLSVSEPADLIQKYLSENTKAGRIEIQVFQNCPIYGRLPIPNARISLCKFIGDGFYVCKVIQTDENGKTEPVAVPTVSAELSQHPDGGVVNATYDITAEAPGFQKIEIFDIPVFDGITSIQNVIMTPLEPPSLKVAPDSESNRGELGGNH